MGKRIRLGVVVSLLAVIIVGCAAAPAPQFLSEEKAGAPAPVESEAEEAPREPTDSAIRGADYAETERLIIRNATLDIVVRDTEEAVDEIEALAGELGGYVVDSNVRKYEEGMRANLRIRVPAERLDPAMERIRDLAVDVNNESISGQDVTEEYVDLRSRLRHLEATEERLLTFMEEAEDTEAALEVYDRLQNIQAESERVRGRMHYLEQSAAMATITINITPSALAQPLQVGRWRPQGTLRNAFESLIKVLQFFVDAVIVIVVLILPVAAVIALPLIGLFFLIRGMVRRRRQKKES